MNTVFFYLPVQDLSLAHRFYREEIGLPVAWHMGDGVSALHLPGTEVQLMLSSAGDGASAGVILQVASVDAFAKEHPALPPRREPYPVPGGRCREFVDPSGWTLFVFEQPGDEDADLFAARSAAEAYFRDWCEAWRAGDATRVGRWISADFQGMYKYGTAMPDAIDKDAFLRDTEKAIAKVGAGRAEWHRHHRAAFGRGPGHVSETVVLEMRTPVGTYQALATEDWRREADGWRLAAEYMEYRVRAGAK